MIQRINFIEKERLQITYGAMLLVFCASLFIGLSIYGVLMLSELRANTNLKRLQADVNRLKKEREKWIAHEEAIQVASPILTIRANLEKQPPWPQLLKTVSSSLPPNVWLVSFKSFDKEDSPSKKGALFNGAAKNPQSLSVFLSALEETPYFEKTVLTSSKEEEGAFNFSISCDISKQRVR